MNVKNARNDGSTQQTIVLRRFDGEPLEIVCLQTPAASPTLKAGPGCQITSCGEGDTQVYRVVLPEGYAVRPVDWRRFATDEPKVRELLERCVRDNPVEGMLEPWSLDMGNRVVGPLALALQDLESMLEVLAVRLEPTAVPGERHLTIKARDVWRGVFNLTVALREPSMQHGID